MTAPLFDIPAHRIDGSEGSLGDYAGSVLLIVNVASACGLTPQYAALEQVYKTYRDKGLVVLGFPANDFGAQEPGTNEEILEFCTTKFAVDFPMFAKISVKGEAQHPIYSELIAAQPQAQTKPDGSLRATLEKYGMLPARETDILWNFEKFLIGRDGQVAARFSPAVTPDDPELVGAIEAELAK